MKHSRASFIVSCLGLNLSRASKITPKLLSSAVSLKSLFIVTLSISPNLSSTIILVSSVDSSLRSLTPSSTFSLTRSAILVTNVARFTLYGIWVITICCLPEGDPQYALFHACEQFPYRFSYKTRCHFFQKYFLQMENLARKDFH